MFFCISQVLKRCFSCILVSNSFRLTKAKKKNTKIGPVTWRQKNYHTLLGVISLFIWRRVDFWAMSFMIYVWDQDVFMSGLHPVFVHDKGREYSLPRPPIRKSRAKVQGKSEKIEEEKKKRFTISRSNNKKVNEYKRNTCFCFSSFYLNDQHKFSLSCSFLWVTLFISSKFKIYGAFALMNANQINKRMIHMVDDLLGGPEQNKEERITCI